MALVESNFSYSYPPISLITSGNAETWVSFTSNSGSNFRSDSNSVISIPINSANAFLNLYRSYLKFDVVGRKADGSVATGASSAITTLGLSSVFSRVRILLGGAEVESLENYPAVSALLYGQASESRKRTLKALEAYGDTAVLTRGGKRTVVHAINSSFMMQKSSLPLPVISGGLTLELTVANDGVFTAGGDISYITVEKLSFNAMMTTPDPSYLQRIFSGLEQGRALYISFVKVKSQLSYGSGGRECQTVLSVGSVSSLQGIAARFVQESDYSTATVDRALISGDAGLRSWHVQIGSTKQPQSRDWANSLANDSTYDPETLALRLFSAVDSYQAGEIMNVDPDPTMLGKQFVLSVNWKSSDEVFGGGYNLAATNGNVIIHTVHKDPVPTTTRIETLGFVDALVEIQRDLIVINDRF